MRGGKPRDRLERRSPGGRHGGRDAGRGRRYHRLRRHPRLHPPPAAGAGALLEAVACVLTLTRRVMYPTINYETPDPKCDLDYLPNEAREGDVETILSNAFGVGGNNALVVFRRWDG